jgi:folylpolyglutamate synthase/dihydropteroate synthase
MSASASIRAARGRFQRRRLGRSVEWIFDVAHNVPAARGLAANLRALPRARTIAVCGILGDKDIAGIPPCWRRRSTRGSS